MANERITENLLRELFRENGYYSNENDIHVEEQKSYIEEVTKLLKGASKSNKGGKGSPEFIISSTSTPDFVIVVECKADNRFHSSADFSKPVDYAVDGALHYARILSRAFNVIAIGASGQQLSHLKISHFLWPKCAETFKPLLNKNGKPIETIIKFDDYVRHGAYDPAVARNRHDDLMAFSRELHEFMRDHAKLTEGEKPLMVSGTLIALRNTAFAKSYSEYSPVDLQKQWLHVIGEEIEKTRIPNSKKSHMMQPYSTIAVHPVLGKSTEKYPKGIMHELIRRLNEKVWPFVSIYHDFDVVGQFYGEFLKYTGGDKKGLGIVLTPRHITELFSLIANIRKNTKVLDICAGTGAFLISAMQQMMKQAVTTDEESYIKEHCLIGVEEQPNMYALGASNMILRGDGKANLYQGSCFEDSIIKQLKNHQCSVGFLNPPYAQSDNGLHELSFVLSLLNCLENGGIGIAIIPMSCAISPHPLREEILRYHTLEAVMSMPDELFYPVGVVTCIMVFTAHIPHESSDKKTWFGYWKNDGYEKDKKKGRIDKYNTWKTIRDEWVEKFRNREICVGKSISYRVNAKDEWCAEAYMETDYQKISKGDFVNIVKKYFIFSFMNEAAEDSMYLNEVNL